jgi:hypothetical protein
MDLLKTLTELSSVKKQLTMLIMKLDPSKFWKFLISYSSEHF